ncbi:hypothetical protein N9549_04495 [Acidimicrobiales bacterium]|nr:hypothetical protein [Acidimicrobiales bacterium]
MKRTVFEEWDRVVNRNSIAGPHPDGVFTPYNDSPFSRSSTGTDLFSMDASGTDLFSMDASGTELFRA